MHKRNELIKKAHKEGKISDSQIARLFGVSRQRIHQIVQGYSSTPSAPITKIPKWWKPNYGIYNVESNNLEGRDRLREIVRCRDSHTCQICSKVWQKEERRFDVHHLDENLEGKKGRKYLNNKDFDRMITLCHKCHFRLDSMRKKLST